MTKPVKVEKYDIKLLDYNKLLNIEEGRTSQLKLLKDNPYIEITNNQTYLLAKMRRTGLLKGRTNIQGVEKKMATQIRKFRTFIGDTANGLIDVTIEAEKKQQIEIDRWEVIRVEKKAEKERLDAERKAKHEQNIADFKKMWEDMIDEVQFKDIMDMQAIAEKVAGVTGDFDEFNEVFELVKVEIIEEYIPKKQDALQLAEDQRVLKVEQDALLKAQAEQEEKERVIKEEKAEVDRIAKEVQEKAEKVAEDTRLKAEVEKKRLRLLPDKERLIETFELINLPVIDKFKSKEAQSVLKAFAKDFDKLIKGYLKKAKEL